MSSNGSKPSKWWFWAFPLAGFCYFGAGLAIGVLLDSLGLVPTWLRRLALIMWPGDYVYEQVFVPACKGLGRPVGAVGLLAFLALWECCWVLLGMLAYRVARGPLAKTEASAVAPEKACRPSRWWFWGAMVAANAYALSLSLSPRFPLSDAFVWVGLLLLELAAIVVGLACYGVAAVVCAVRRGRRKGGNESQE